jgi:hypothetical protein
MWVLMSCGLASSCGTRMKCVIMFPRLVRSLLSSDVHTRVDSGSSTAGGSKSSDGPGDEGALASHEGAAATSAFAFPRFRPSKFVVGVPVTIHRRSTLSNFVKGVNTVESDADTWPSSITSRFQRICSSGEHGRGLHTHFGTRTLAYSAHVHGCHSVLPRFLSSLVKPAIDFQLSGQTNG